MLILSGGEIDVSEFEWSEELKVGVDCFDSQHKKWIELAREVNKALQEEYEVDLISAAESKAQAEKIIEEAFTEFLLYTRRHLRAEEKQMRKYDFPGYEEHRKEHNKYRNLVQKIKKIYKENSREGKEKLLQFLREWLLKHIKQTDKKYGDYFPSKLEIDETT